MKVMGVVAEAIKQKARYQISQVAQGNVKVRKIKATGSKCINVGIRHRLLHMNGSWVLMTHERYNRYVRG